MWVDQEEANLYLFHKVTSPQKNQIIVLDPDQGMPIKVKSIGFDEDFMMISSEARSNGTLYFSAMSSNQAHICKNIQSVVGIKWSNVPISNLNSNVLNSLDVKHSVQTVFNNTSIILSVSTSQNYLNCSVITYDYDLNPI